MLVSNYIINEVHFQISLLSLQRPSGIFAVFEDECRLQTSTDLGFVEKLDKVFSKHEHYKKSKSKEAVFSIAHYPGQVLIFQSISLQIKCNILWRQRSKAPLRDHLVRRPSVRPSVCRSVTLLVC